MLWEALLLPTSPMHHLYIRLAIKRHLYVKDGEMDSLSDLFLKSSHCADLLLHGIVAFESLPLPEISRLSFLKVNL